MPRYGKRKRYSRKKVYRRKRKRTYRRKSRTNILGGVSTIFPKLKRTLRYTTDVSLDPGAGTIALHAFSANSAYDPDYTGVGNSPMMWDQLIALYDHAVVIGCKMTVTFINTTVTPVRVGISAKDSGVLSAGIHQLLQQDRTRHLTIPGVGDGGSSVKTLTVTMNPNKFLSRSKPLSDPDLKNSSASGPTEQAYLIIWACGIDGSENPGAVTCNVKIEYTTLFLEPKMQAES